MWDIMTRAPAESRGRAGPLADRTGLARIRDHEDCTAGIPHFQAAMRPVRLELMGNSERPTMNHPDSPNPAPSDPGATAMPSFRPPGPPPQPYAGSPQNPYAQQPGHSAPHEQTPPLYGYQTPYGQVPPPYGVVPPMGGPRRPVTATAAAILGIISGSLGIFIVAGALNVAISNWSRSSSDPVASATSLFLSLTTIAIVTGLLVCGIRFLGGKGYKLLLSSVVAQAVMTTFLTAMMLYGAQFIADMNSTSSNRSAAAGLVVLAVFYGLVGLGLSISNVILLLRPATRLWVKQVS